MDRCRLLNRNPLARHSPLKTILAPTTAGMSPKHVSKSARAEPGQSQQDWCVWHLSSDIDFVSHNLHHISVMKRSDFE
eukprot:5825550-Karenia_brevis.AAC.1